MKSQGFYPNYNLGLCALKAGWAESIPAEDRPAFLAWDKDDDGLVRCRPMTVDLACAYLLYLWDGGEVLA